MRSFLFYLIPFNKGYMTIRLDMEKEYDMFECDFIKKYFIELGSVRNGSTRTCSALPLA